MTTTTEWRSSPPDADGWWWIWMPKDRWAYPVPYLFHSLDGPMGEITHASYGPTTPFTGWGKGIYCAPMDEPPAGWESMVDAE